jgi:hypothetical protein
MEEHLSAGLVTLAVALPCMALGVAILTGKVRPAQVAEARDQERARRAVGGFLLLLNALVAGLGVLLVAGSAQADTFARWGAGLIVAVAVLGIVPLLRAVQP